MIKVFNIVLKTVIGVLIVFLALFLGYQYGYYKANWAERLIKEVPLVSDRAGGVFRERNKIVLFGVVQKVNIKDKKVDIKVLNKIYSIKIVPSSIVPVERPFENTEVGDKIYVDMTYDKPFIADRVYFVSNITSNP